MLGCPVTHAGGGYITPHVLCGGFIGHFADALGLSRFAGAQIAAAPFDYESHQLLAGMGIELLVYMRGMGFYCVDADPEFFCDGLEAFGSSHFAQHSFFLRRKCVLGCNKLAILVEACLEVAFFCGIVSWGNFGNSWRFVGAAHYGEAGEEQSIGDEQGKRLSKSCG